MRSILALSLGFLLTGCVLNVEVPKKVSHDGELTVRHVIVFEVPIQQCDPIEDETERLSCIEDIKLKYENLIAEFIRSIPPDTMSELPIGSPTPEPAD